MPQPTLPYMMSYECHPVSVSLQHDRILRSLLLCGAACDEHYRLLALT